FARGGPDDGGVRRHSWRDHGAGRRDPRAAVRRDHRRFAGCHQRPAGPLITAGLGEPCPRLPQPPVHRRDRAHAERGQSMVEFTIVLVPLLLILFGIIEFGLVMYDKVTVVHDAREATRLAAVNDVSGQTLLADAPAGSTLTFTC